MDAPQVVARHDGVVARAHIQPVAHLRMSQEDYELIETCIGAVP